MRFLLAFFRRLRRISPRFIFTNAARDARAKRDGLTKPPRL